jgi:phosphoenolpyruvate synthase/pyruvate phosphate dikinase
MKSYLLRKSSELIESIMHTKRAYTFDEYRDSERFSLIFGIKGSNLCRVARFEVSNALTCVFSKNFISAGVPVPPGFIISSEAYFDYLSHGATIYDKLAVGFTEIIYGWEDQTGRRFSPDHHHIADLTNYPMLFAVRFSCGLADLSR